MLRLGNSKRLPKREFSRLFLLKWEFKTILNYEFLPWWCKIVNFHSFSCPSVIFSYLFSSDLLQYYCATARSKPAKKKIEINKAKKEKKKKQWQRKLFKNRKKMIKQERKMKKIPRVCRQGIKLEIPELFIAIYPRHHLPLSYNNLLATNVSRFSPPCTFPTPSSDSNCLFPATEKLLKIFLPQNDLTSVGLLLFLF